MEQTKKKVQITCLLPHTSLIDSTACQSSQNRHINGDKDSSPMHMLHQVHIVICLLLKTEEINTVSQQKFSLHINWWNIKWLRKHVTSIVHSTGLILFGMVPLRQA